jgi:hypothetical protein
MVRGVWCQGEIKRLFEMQGKPLSRQFDLQTVLNKYKWQRR